MLISENIERYTVWNVLTPIDIFKVQKLYECNSIDIPEIVHELYWFDKYKMSQIRIRFRLEASFNGIGEELIEKYVEKTFKTCGLKHFWPVNYPIVESKHRLYTLMCIKKKTVLETCMFSIECEDEYAVCVRPFFKKVGICVRPDNEQLNQLSRTVNDSMFIIGNTMKSAYGSIKDSIFGK